MPLNNTSERVRAMFVMEDQSLIEDPKAFKEQSQVTSDSLGGIAFRIREPTPSFSHVKAYHSPRKESSGVVYSSDEIDVQDDIDFLRKEAFDILDKGRNGGSKAYNPTWRKDLVKHCVLGAAALAFVLSMVFAGFLALKQADFEAAEAERKAATEKREAVPSLPDIGVVENEPDSTISP